jgi:hypothetical protein
VIAPQLPDAQRDRQAALAADARDLELHLTGIRSAAAGCGQCLSWVKPRRTQCEQMSSGLPLKADVAQCSQHFTFGRVEDGRGSWGPVAIAPFPIPLIEPDVRHYRIRLSDWFHREAHDSAANGRRSRRMSPRSP